MANSLILKRHFNGNFDFTFYFIHVMSVDTKQAQYSHTDFDVFSSKSTKLIKLLYLATGRRYY